MRINSNIAALNTLNQLGKNEKATNSSLAKLSSGLRINSAADDAAGLAISEKMKGQIRGLDKASSNSEDGISMVQTAEGALEETESILQRMRELAVQSSSDTVTDDDRDNIQDEMSQLIDEIDRISQTTQFNTKNLLDGSMSAKSGDTDVNNVLTNTALDEATTLTTKLTALSGDSASLGIVSGDTVEISWTVGGEAKTASVAVVAATDLTSLLGQVTGGAGASGTASGDITFTASTKGDAGAVEGLTFKVIESDGTTERTAASTALSSFTETTKAVSDTANVLTNTALADTVTASTKLTALEDDDGNSLELVAGDTIKLSWAVDGELNTASITVGTSTTLDDLLDKIGSTSGTTITGDGTSTVTNGDMEVTANKVGYAGALGGLTFEVTDSDGNSKTKAANVLSSFEETTAAKEAKKTDGSATLQIGANAGQTMKVSIGDMGADALGIANLDLSSQDGANVAITVIDEATSKVSKQRSNLGAIQNRLEHTINNLDTASENLSSAQSQIADVDMAAEMSEYTKNNVLAQAAQSMLAQANQQPQQVLALLQ